MEESKLKTLIEKCLAGKASREEQLMLDEWYASHDTARGLTDQLDEDQKKAVSGRMLSTINDEIEKQDNGKTKTVALLRRYGPILAAASVILVILYWSFSTYKIDKPVKAAGEMDWVEVSGVDGKVIADTLTDGSIVWINAKSKIRYSRNFTGREVWLEGEAYFDVSPDPEHPFHVHAGDLTTRVLGTEFNIRIDELDKQVTVTVTEGRVSVTNNVKNLGVLQVNDQLLFDLKTGEHKQQKTDAMAVTAWREGLLVFKKIRFGEIATVLENKFDSKIKFSNPEIGNCIMTGSFDNQMKIKDILLLLCRINGNRLTEHENSFTISGKGCPNE